MELPRRADSGDPDADDAGALPGGACRSRRAASTRQTSILSHAPVNNANEVHKRAEIEHKGHRLFLPFVLPHLAFPLPSVLRQCDFALRDMKRGGLRTYASWAYASHSGLRIALWVAHYVLTVPSQAPYPQAPRPYATNAAVWALAKRLAMRRQGKVHQYRLHNRSSEISSKRLH